MAPVASASASQAPVDTPTPPAIVGSVVKMYPVVSIYSLIDVVPADGTVEIRLGHDPGGGMIGEYSYVPIVNGAPDLEQESETRSYVNTASGGLVEIAGKRPDLVYHAVSGFRSAATDNGYLVLGPDQMWKGLSVGPASGLGAGIYSWSKDRLLEWRRPSIHDIGETLLPELRVLRGADTEAPTIPKATARSLVKEGFFLTTLRVLRTGEVIASGTVTDTKKIGTLLWRDDVKTPTYFVTEVDPGAEDSPGLEILGGTSLANVRLRFGDSVMKLDGNSWQVESTVAKGALPDVWFGAPLVMSNEKGVAFARVAEGSPWTPIEVVAEEVDSQSFAVDAAGVIWKTEDQMLLSSKPRGAPLPEITEEALVERHKKSVLRGGSHDATGEAPTTFGTRTCRMYYVLLDQSPIPASDTGDYPRIRGALKGHTEFAKVKLIVSRERGIQLFGAQTADEDTATKLAALVSKSVKGSKATSMCAEPPVHREIKVDLTTGDALK